MSTDTHPAETALVRLRQEVATRSGLSAPARYFIGIDLGTTNSCAAVFDFETLRQGHIEKAVRMISVSQPSADGTSGDDRLLPSVVAQPEPNAGWIVGRGARDARRRGLLRGRDIFFSTKSEMGLGAEPFYVLAADASLDAPYKVAGRILGALRDAIVREVGEEALRNAVVTVPASFQVAARQDTLKAAALAGLPVSNRALLDEPNAALLDWLLTLRLPSRDARLDLRSRRVVLVLDFGGGTCDVSIVTVKGSEPGRLSLANLAISRYERLGGDNIDAAIAEQVLLPKLLARAKIQPLAVSFSEKRDVLLPQLLPVAEALKHRLCENGGLDTAIHPPVTVEMPQRLEHPPVRWDMPVLERARFDAVLGPFLDPDLLYPQDSELNPVTSVFAPIADALNRAHLTPHQVDAVLLAGGSCLIPKLRSAVRAHFRDAQLLNFPSRDRTFFAVARGAALHSFFLHGLDRPLLHPIAQETIGLVAEGHAFVPLIPAGTELPFPPDGSLRPMDDLVVPRDLMKSVEIVLAADSAEKVLSVAHLAVPGVRSAGQEIKVGYRLDANKVLELHAHIASDPSARCEIVLENPLCSTRVRSTQERRILELERTVKRVGSDSAKAASTARELTNLCYAERSFERSIDWGRQAMATLGRPDASILFTMALAYERLNAVDRAERCYREATKANPHASSSWFNLGLLLTRQGRLEEAWRAMDEACRVAPRAGGYRAARGWVAKKRGLEQEAISDWEEAARIFDAEGLHDEFDRSWRRYAAECLGDRPLADKLLAPVQDPAPATPYDPRKLPALRAGALVLAG